MVPVCPWKGHQASVQVKLILMPILAPPIKVNNHYVYGGRVN